MCTDRDYCDKDGALRVKADIEKYWLERGYRVEAKLVPMKFHAAMRSARFDVRCDDIVNGMPLARCKIGAAANENQSFDPTLLVTA